MAHFTDKHGVPVGWSPETPHDRVVRLQNERKALIEKVDSGNATNSEAKRIVEIEGLCAAITGSMPF